MGQSQGAVRVQFLVTEDGPNDFEDFDNFFNSPVEDRPWQWKIRPFYCGEEGCGGRAEKCHKDKLKEPKQVALVTEKCQALIFQIGSPDRVGAINYELELPYQNKIPIVIFCGNPTRRPNTEVVASVQAKFSENSSAKCILVLPYDGEKIPTLVRDQAMDWLILKLELPVEEEPEKEDAVVENLSLVVVGSAHVGKTSLLQRYVHDNFDPNQTPTMGIDKFTVSRKFRFPGQRAQRFILDIWDTAGESRFRTVTLAFYNSAHG